MSNWEDMLKGLVKSAGKVGLEELETTLEEISEEADTPMKKIILRLASEAVDAYGLEGLDRIESLIDCISGDEEPQIDFASLKARSDYLAALQNSEADEKSDVEDFFHGLGGQIGVIVKAILSGLAS